MSDISSDAHNNLRKLFNSFGSKNKSISSLMKENSGDTKRLFVWFFFTNVQTAIIILDILCNDLVFLKHLKPENCGDTLFINLYSTITNFKSAERGIRTLNDMLPYIDREYNNFSDDTLDKAIIFNIKFFKDVQKIYNEYIIDFSELCSEYGVDISPFEKNSDDIYEEEDDDEDDEDEDEDKQPQTLAGIFRLTPKTNCTECGQPSCMIFAREVLRGKLKISDCPYI
jgi:ArsR family metal-binding transcriptional regulator